MMPRLMFLVLLGTLSPGVLASGTDMPETTETQSCREIDAWIREHADMLPTLYDDFVRYPQSFRKRMLGHLTPGAQAALWRTHLTRAAGDRRDLNEEQRDLIARIVDVLDAGAFVRRQIPIAMATIAAVFPDQQMQTALFAQIGPSSEIGKKSPPEPDAVKICECSSSTWINECGGIYGAGVECHLQPWTECERQGTGCGFLGWWACDGLCCDWTGYCF